MITKDREYRNFTFEVNDEMKVTGIPVVFNQETVLYEIDGVEFKEVISPDAFKNTDLSDVVLNIDHEGKPAAKTRNGTLLLEVKEDGVHMDADLSKNVTGRELYEDINNSFYDKMSFAFSHEDEKYDRETRTRTITNITRLYDVSAVTYPAYNQTSLSARSFFEQEREKELKAKELANLKKRKLQLLIKISGGKQ